MTQWAASLCCMFAEANRKNLGVTLKKEFLELFFITLYNNYIMIFEGHFLIYME
jgi:hypothetical protein